MLALLALLVFTTGLQAENSAEPLGDELLRITPAESLFCVRVNNFDHTVGMMDQFLAGASPVPMGISMLARMQLAGVLGDPALNNVKMGGSFSIFAVIAPGQAVEAQPTQNVFIAGLLPITDFQQFASGNPNCSQPDANGISKITVSDMTGKTKTTLITKVGGYALTSSEKNYDKLVATTKSMSAGTAAGLAGTLDAEEIEKAAKEPLWAYGNVQLVSKTFGPMVFAQLENIKTMMEKTNASGQASFGDPAAIINMYAVILEALMKETHFLSLTIRPKPDVCNLTMSIAAVPGTDMANMFVANTSPAQENKLLAYLEDGAAMNFGCSLNKTFVNQLNSKSIDMLATIAGEDTTAEEIAKTKTWLADTTNALGESLAFSLSTDAKQKPPLAAEYVIAIKDEKTFNRALEEATQMVNTGAIANFYKSMGMVITYTMSRDVDRYKGVSIDSAKLVMKPTEPNSPQAQVTDAMYGDGFQYRWGIMRADRLCACVVGGDDVDSSIRKLIDKVKAGRLQQEQQMAAEINAAMGLLPEADKADFMGTYNYVRLLKMATALAPVPMPEIDIPTKSNIAFAGKIGGGKMAVEVAMPKEHLTELTAAFQMLQQQKLEELKKQQQKTATQPVPDDKKPAEDLGDDRPIDDQDAMWVKCKNDNCEAAYQIGMKYYFRYLGKHQDPMSMKPANLVCKKCGKESIYRAEKCDKCGLVFKRGAVPHDFADRCPTCKYSGTEDRRKRAREAKRQTE
jgi:predicted Zn-ribbon and HTH transcriptional regulator